MIKVQIKRISYRVVMEIIVINGLEEFFVGVQLGISVVFQTICVYTEIDSLIRY